MSGISSSVGLISGINSADLVDQLMSLERLKVDRLESRVTTFESTQNGIELLESNLSVFEGMFTSLSTKTTHEQIKTTVSDTAQMTVTTSGLDAIGNYSLQTLQLSDNDQYRSKGYSDRDSSTLGTGSITIASDGFLNEPTLIEELNGGAGIRRGSFEITDRSGAKAEIDISDAYTVDEILTAINSAEEIDVEAFAEGDKLVLRDRTGSTTSNLIVKDLKGGGAAADLGIVGSVSADKISGSSIFELTADFKLSALNDGNGLRLDSGTEDLVITLTDDTVINIDLEDVTNIQSFLNAINDHEDNGGKVLASFENERFKLEDLSGGGGSSSFQVENGANSEVLAQLGLDVTESGGVITSRKLTGGMNSVLLRNLNGGSGIGTLGTLDLTDRAGNTATVDLSNAESLDEVLTAINDAETGGGTKLQIRAYVNSDGTGITIEDFSGATDSNLVVADSGGGTIAADLNIAVDAAETSVESGALNLQYANAATKLSDFTQNDALSTGSIRVTDAAGRDFTVSVSSSVTDIGDLIERVALEQGDITGSAEVLLSNLNGGEGAGTLGSIDVTDRSGKTATLDLSGATTLDDVITAINNAQDAGLNDLSLEARINSAGTGIIIEDNSGATASNLVIADVGGSTLAAELNITVDAAQKSINSGDLNHQSVRVQLNEFGDGFTLVDYSGGAGDLEVEEIDSDTAEDLGILGSGTTGGDGRSQIQARLSTVIEVEADDTLDDILAKLGSDTRNATANIFNSGSNFNPFHLNISSENGAENRLVINTSGIDFKFDQTSVAKDARLRLGEEASTGFVLSSNDNTFDDVAGFLDVTVTKVATTVSEVTVTRNTNSIKSQLQTFVSAFNSLVDTTNQLTKFDIEENSKGILQGSGLVLRIRQRMDSLISKTFGSNTAVKDLSQLGITFTEGGKVAFDAAKFDSIIASNPDDVRDFFLNETRGFAKSGTSVVESVTGDQGAATLEKEALQNSIDDLNTRIEQLDEILAVRKQRLLIQFVNMENILGDLQSQQQTLTQIATLSKS
ncbi:Flagellar hook-associated protein 2 [Polystyrenella longa]|uniref:Filament cap protein n=1 Tax=Polystyrenella longa TaxID=2528007 RepID=A0A518CIW9_9PLAN|nr:flagellar filament capping protein FliD [Polystyrenella longa]QDU79172.1 Flagellar hook-associated protein 2 [Polystyrenella longa]